LANLVQFKDWLMSCLRDWGWASGSPFVHATGCFLVATRLRKTEQHSAAAMWCDDRDRGRT